MGLIYITSLSVLFQISAIVMALRLIRISRSRTAWTLVSMGIVGMGVRRSMTLVRLLAGETPHAVDMPYEIVGLFTSMFMFAGIYFISPIFESIRKEEKEREIMVRDLEEALANVKTLKGLLPICASCKKIRDDKGYWNKLETYIGLRTDAEFSHSICPECQEKFYPGFRP